MTDAEGRDPLPYRPVLLTELRAVSTGAPTKLPFLLAVKFNYDVKQGGFAQFLYNLRGEFLADVENMLIAAGAAVAHDYYVRAITACLEDKATYFRFLSSDFAEPSAVKHSLQLLTVEYLQLRADFAQEATAFLASCPRA